MHTPTTPFFGKVGNAKVIIKPISEIGSFPIIGRFKLSGFFSEVEPNASSPPPPQPLPAHNFFC